jgi:hypothetical protein
MDDLNPRARRFKRAEYDDERDLEAFWAEVRPRREPMQQRWFLPLIVVLLALSIPWYRKSGEIGAIVLGLPVWVWVALACSALVAATTALMAFRFWDDDDPRERED